MLNQWWLVHLNISELPSIQRTSNTVSEIKTSNVRTNFQGWAVFHFPICACNEIVSCGMVAYRRLKTIEIFKPSAPKVVAVAYGRRSHRGVLLKFFFVLIGNTSCQADTHTRDVSRKSQVKFALKFNYIAYIERGWLSPPPSPPRIILSCLHTFLLACSLFTFSLLTTCIYLNLIW